MTYRRRLIDGVLDELMPDLAAIALEGAKGVGKTATASQRASTIIALNDPRQREVVGADPDYIIELPRPVLLDEWQFEPTVWDRVRRAVDDDPTGGHFLLTGSAGLGAGVRVHSGAGRIVRLVMRPLGLSERGLLEPTVSLRHLLAGSRPRIAGRSSVGLSQYVDEIARSGFPGIRSLPERAREAQLESYVDRIVDRELPESGVTIRRPSALRSWLAAYAAATSSDASYTTILDAATAGQGDKPARATVDSYREHLQRIFVLDPLPAWVPTFNALKRLTYGPKHHLVDPAVAWRMVGVGKAALLRGHGDRVPAAAAGSWLGALFESLAVQSVRACAQVAGARVSHLRTKNSDHEVDVIVEGSELQVVAIEVKLGATVSDSDVRHLEWLADQLGDRLADRVVVTTGQSAYRRPDGVAVVPLALLGP